MTSKYISSLSCHIIHVTSRHHVTYHMITTITFIYRSRCRSFHVYGYTHTHICTYTYIYVYINIYIHINTHTFIPWYTYLNLLFIYPLFILPHLIYVYIYMNMFIKHKKYTYLILLQSLIDSFTNFQLPSLLKSEKSTNLPVCTYVCVCI